MTFKMVSGMDEFPAPGAAVLSITRCCMMEEYGEILGVKKIRNFQISPMEYGLSECSLVQKRSFGSLSMIDR